MTKLLTDEIKKMIKISTSVPTSGPLEDGVRMDQYSGF